MDNLQSLPQQLTISPSLLSQLDRHLQPRILDRDSTAFDIGVEYQKDETRRFILQQLGRATF